MSADQQSPEQIAIGSNIALAKDGSTAIVNVYQLAAAQPIDRVAVVAAHATLSQLPLDELPKPAVLPPGSRMPFAPNRLFVGREDDLRALARIIMAGGTAAIGQIAVATGLGGIGKTQLAAEFAHRYGQYFVGGVFWLSFADTANVSTEVALCGGAGGLDLRPDFASLKIDDQVALVSAAWQSPLPRLLIFDNCEDEQLLPQWRPRTGGCRIIVTSRRDKWNKGLVAETFAVGVLNRPESIALLRKFRPDLKEDDPALNATAKELGDLPLALHLAGSYLERYQHSANGQPVTYLAALRRPDLLDHPSLHGLKDSVSPTGHEHHVARTFALSYDQLSPNDSQDELARQLLQRAACLAPGDPIPRDLLKKTQGWEADTDDTSLEDALLRLGELGLLETDAAGGLRLHRLLAAFVAALGLAAEVYTLVEQTVAAEAMRINHAGLPSPLMAWRAHLSWVAAEAESRQSGRAGWLWDELGHHQMMIGDYASAKLTFERALRTDEVAYGFDHPNVAIRVNSLGDVLRILGDFGEAKAAFERALHISETAYGPDSTMVCAALNSIGMLLKDQADYAGARGMLERALQIAQTSYGPVDPSLANVLSNLGMVKHQLGDHRGAKAAYEQALHIDEVAFGSEHPHVATRINNLGMVLHDLGAYTEARAAFERALRIDEVAYGPNHPDVSTDVNNLGLVLQKLHDLPGARAAYERALQIDETVYGSNHLRVAIDIHNLGTVLFDQGDRTGAHAAYDRALQIGETVFGDDHPQVAMFLCSLGQVMYVQSDLEGAKSVLARAVGIFEQTLGPNHPYTQSARNDLIGLSQIRLSKPKICERIRKPRRKR